MINRDTSAVVLAGGKTSRMSRAKETQANCSDVISNLRSEISSLPRLELFQPAAFNQLVQIL
jgi:molybdopterin-guanine dinucleotide biosynthesis protein A